MNSLKESNIVGGLRIFLSERKEKDTKQYKTGKFCELGMKL